MGGEEMSGLHDLSADDLSGLRLAAQVMAHRAQLVGRPRVVLFFDSLEAAVMAEQAARAQFGRSGLEAVGQSSLLSGGTGGDDRQLIAEYLDLLAQNDRLSGELRAYCRMLRSAVITHAAA